MIEIKTIIWLIPVIILSRCYLSKSKVQTLRCSVYAFISSVGAMAMNYGGSKSLAILIITVLLISISIMQKASDKIDGLNDE
tara:strand:+ start:1847 stop:2092 length:246 start_codon:yes stop_codon:yes gene_type:complete